MKVFMSGIIAVLFLGHHAKSQLVIEGTSEFDNESRIKGYITLPPLYRAPDMFDLTWGMWKNFELPSQITGNVFTMNQSGTIFGLNSAPLGPSNQRIEFAWIDATLSDVRVLVLHPILNEIGNIPAIRENSVGSVDLLVLQKSSSEFDGGGGQLFIGTQGGFLDYGKPSTKDTQIYINHPIELSKENKATLRAFAGETLFKAQYYTRTGSFVGHDPCQIELKVGLNTEKVARIDIARGSEAFIKRQNGDVDSASEDKWVFEGDTITTGIKSFVKLIYTDGSVDNIGPKSEYKIIKYHKYDKDNTSIFELVKGFVRKKVIKDYLLPPGKYKSKLFIRGSETAIGVRGTDFSVEVKESNGMGSVTASVTEGIVDFINERIGDILVLEAGQSNVQEFFLDEGSSPRPINLDTVVKSEIYPEGESDLYSFNVEQESFVTLESIGNLDTIGYLFDSDGWFIAQNNDMDKNSRNFRISKKLLPGNYLLSVRESGDLEGGYSLKVTHEPLNAPVLKFISQTQFSNSRSFIMSASISGHDRLQSLSYRIKPPGDAQFSSWRENSLDTNGRNANWSTSLALTKEGRWDVEIQARDVAGKKSKIGTIKVIADWKKPAAKILSAASVSRTRYWLKADLEDSIRLSSVRYRLKKPREKNFGAWNTEGLSGNKIKQMWSRSLSLSVTGLWIIELQASDSAGNISETSVIRVNQKLDQD